MPQIIAESSINAFSGGTSESVSISTTSAKSSPIGNAGDTQYAVIYSTIDCFMRQGADPTALATGVDQFIPANVLLRVANIIGTNKIAFVTASGSGTVYITPGA